MNLQTLLDSWQDEGLISAESRPDLIDAVNSESADATQAWYVRFFIGFSAWIAAILFVAALATLNLFDDELMLAGAGLVFCFSALMLKRWLVARNSLFLHQLALAGSLGGLLMFGAGVGQYFNDITPTAFATIGLAALLFFLFPDRLHRVLMVTVMIGMFEVWCFDAGFEVGFHLLMWVLAGSSVWLWHKEPRRWEGISAEYAIPLSYALPLALLISLLPMITAGDDTYWLSSIGIVGAALYAAWHVLAELGLEAGDKTGLVLAFAILLVGTLCNSVPGVLASLLMLAVAWWRGNRVIGGVALIVLVFSITDFFVSLYLEAFAMSLTLLATGAVLLLARAALPSGEG